MSADKIRERLDEMEINPSRFIIKVYRERWNQLINALRVAVEEIEHSRNNSIPIGDPELKRILDELEGDYE